MITLLWTRKPNLGSYLIRKITNSSASHFAVAFDKKVVFESTINAGVHLSFYSEFMSKNQVVWSIDTEHSLAEEELIWLQCAGLDGLKYDYFGALYLAWFLIKRDYNGESLPIEPKFSENRSYLCVEVARCLKPIFNIPVDLSVTTPDELYEILRSQGRTGEQ